MTETGGPRPRRAWIARLGPRGEVDVDRAASPYAVVEDAVARVGADPVRWAIELNSVVVRRIVDEVPALGGSPAAVELLRRGNEATTLRALFTLVEGSAAAPPTDEAILEGIREFVHRAVPLERVLHGVRVGHAATTEAFLRACAELVDPEVAVDEVTAISRELFSYVDDLSDTMIRAYLVEHEVWSTSAAAARADIVRSLLSDATTTDIGEASRVLGYDLRRTHEAVVVWSDTSNGSSTLQAAATEALRARGATTTLVIPVASGRLWAWGTVPSDGTRRPGSWESIADALSRQQTQAAFGAPGGGVEGFRRSHREALRGERVERLRREAGRMPRHATAYADVAAIALLATDLDAAGDFVRRELGGLATRSASMEALRTTLYHYIGAERSLVDVARRLHVARGTVTYRVKRAQEVLGHGLDDRLFTLHTALALAEELGDAVLLPRDVAER
ncbi:PucR family transcriptional regulator [Streptomyces melanosporofaciens]|uniref:DNA-binding transcriptional regulator, PucR family n=1 Tax=Streptomyces melanosporofaciens TaxID=67327 RepID=A0A1H4ZI92_STRMJ|nr:helix-turn-helix domain-containing protein [Streptomyces melanosporofaciens]SED29849.1 DNA-binding transcriptional regulator, PucR family [Streptomyces melanosporofaciens]